MLAKYRYLKKIKKGENHMPDHLEKKYTSPQNRLVV